MKIKFLLALACSAAITASAQGYKDGIEYYKAGQFDNAITLLNRNMGAADTDKALANYYLGQAYLAKGDKVQAQKCFNDGVAANPDCAYNYVGLGALQLLDKNASAANDNFKKAQGLAKKNTEVLVDIARAYYNADPVAYTKEIDKLIAKAHKDSKDKEPAIYIFEGDRLAKQQNWNDAATQYEQAIFFDEDNPEGYVKYANVYFYINPDFATQRLSELLQRRPNSALAQRELADKYYQNDKWTRAADQYGKYMENPNHFPEDKARYGVLLFAGQKYDDAVRVSREVLGEDPDNFQAHRIVVRSLDELKDKAGALAESEKFFAHPKFADRLSASDYTTHARLLDASNDSVNQARSIALLKDAAVKFPKDTQVLYALADYYDGKDYPVAAEYIDQYINAQEQPDRSELFSAARICLGAVYASKDNPEQAEKFAAQGVKYMERSMDGLPTENIPPSFIRRLALLQMQRNDNIANEEVVATFNRLLERMNLNPEYSNPASDKNLISYYVDAYRSIAQYYTSVGDTEQADAAKAKMEEYNALLAK